MDIDVDYIKKVMGLVMIEENPEKYIEDIKKIIRLFDELDRFDEVVKSYPPLYHSLERMGRLRSDIKMSFKTNIKELTDNVYEDYVAAPPIKGVKKIGKH